MYRVMLHNDTFNRHAYMHNADQVAYLCISHRLIGCRREYVVRVLMKVIDGLTVDDAVNVMQVCFASCAGHNLTENPVKWIPTYSMPHC